MELYYLKEFVVLAETNNFAKVAETLSISASSVSRHIQTIEDELGVALLERNTRGVQLTSYGEIFLPYAKQFALLERQYVREIAEAKNANMNKLVIGSSSRYINELLANFYLYDSSIDIEYMDYSDDILLEMLRLGQCEIVFIDSSFISGSEFVSVPFEYYRYAVALPSSHPLAGRSSISLGELTNEKFVLEKSNDYFIKRVEEIFKQVGFEPKSVMYVGRAAMSFIAVGTGVSIMAKRIDGVDNVLAPNISIVDLKPETTLQISVCYLKKTKLTKAAQRLVDYLIRVWPTVKK